MAENDDGNSTSGAPPTHIHIEKKAVNWLAWALLLLGVLALLLALSRCRHDDAPPAAATVAATPAPTDTVIAETSDAPRSAPLAATAALGGYLAGSEPTPRTFVFDKLHFDTAKSDIRAVDRADVDAVAATLKQYPGARIRIAGYADARGSQPSNLALGKARAESVKAALVAKGIDAGRIATASGGEGDPVDSNTTAAGQAENRRTELVVTQR